MEIVKEKRIYLASPHIGELEKEFVKEAFDTNWVAPLGPNVDSFEREVAEYVGSPASAALVSGTSAIHMAIKLAGVESGDLVFCSSLTFAASCEPIIYEDAKPVFIDSEPESFNMCPRALRKAFEHYSELGQKPKAVIVVHLYGQSAKMDEIMAICNEYNVPVIEDAAESLGGTYKGAHTGTIGDYGIYSFNGNKIITTSGGGMLVSKYKEATEKAKFWATQSRDKARHYEHSELGYNYRMSNVLAGIGRGQLRILEERIALKKNIYETYKEGFKDIKEIEMAPIMDYGKPNYWLSIMTLSDDSRVSHLDIILALEERNIEARPIWKPIHMQPYYEKYDFFTMCEEGSVAEKIFNSGLCLPSDTKMTEEDMEKVISIIRGLFGK